MMGNISCFCCHLPFLRFFFFKNFFQEHYESVNCLDPDQDRHSVMNVGPDLGPSCLQRLSADDKSPPRTLVKNA